MCRSNNGCAIISARCADQAIFKDKSNNCAIISVCIMCRSSNNCAIISVCIMCRSSYNCAIISVCIMCRSSNDCAIISVRCADQAMTVL